MRLSHRLNWLYMRFQGIEVLSSYGKFIPLNLATPIKLYRSHCHYSYCPIRQGTGLATIFCIVQLCVKRRNFFVLAIEDDCCTLEGLKDYRGCSPFAQPLTAQSKYAIATKFCQGVKRKLLHQLIHLASLTSHSSEFSTNLKTRKNLQKSKIGL